jgi:branched-chain amino acid transport system substrate-binding protein
MNRFVAAVIAVLVIAFPAGMAAAADKSTYEINAVLSQTGPAAFIGASESKMLGIVEALANKRGGIDGHPVKFVINDDQSNPLLAVQFVNKLIAQKVPVIYGPGFVGTCSAVMALTQKDGPVTWCLAPGIYPPAGGYVFSVQANTDDTVLVLIRYFRERGWKRIGVIATTDASGQAYDHGVRFALAQPENKDVELVAYEHMNPTDISAAAQIARVKAANPQGVLTLATGTPWGTIMRGLSDGGVAAPVGGGNGNLIINQLTQYAAFLPTEMYFPGNIAVAPDSISKGPIADAQALYFKAFADAGLKPDLGYNIGWDPAMLLIDLLRKHGVGATAQQLRDDLVALHGWAGIAGIYDFRDGMQRGVGPRSLVIDRWDKTKSQFIAVSRPAGFLK